jgi:hypothetical protein
MRKSIVLFFLISSVMCISGQQAFIESGVAISAFDYRNSRGEAIENLFGVNSFFLQTGYHAITPVYRLNYLTALSYTRYGARGSDESVGNYFDWDAGYLGAVVGLDYDLIRKRIISSSQNDITVYIKTSISAEFLVNGTQTINNEVYSLVGVEQFRYPFLFVRGGSGASYSVSKLFTVFAEYTGGKGFPFKSGDTDKEKLKISSHNFGFGIYVNLPAYKSWR